MTNKEGIVIETIVEMHDMPRNWLNNKQHKKKHSSDLNKDSLIAQTKHFLR